MVKFNDEIIEQLCNAREHGLNITDCANLCNVSRETIYSWLKKGEKAKSGKYKQFYERFQKASTKFKFYHLDKITKDESWQSSAWILERTFPDEYGRKEKHEVDSKSNVNITNVKTIKETMTEYEDYLKEIKSEMGTDTNNNSTE